MNMFTRINAPLKKIIKPKKVQLKNVVKENNAPIFHCWYGHFGKYENDPEFKYKIILKKKFSTVSMSNAKIDMVGVMLVGVSQLV